MPLVRRLQDTSLNDLSECGGKAARLGEAMGLGCPVPDGVVLSTDLYRRFMQQWGLQGEIRSILTTMHPTGLSHFQAVEWAIQSAFKVRRMPKEVEAAIRQAWQLIDGQAVAVRSSATNEDSPQQSFVGQHATYLNIDSQEAAIEAVIGCWTSLFSAKALYYAHRFGVDLLNSAMAVLIQQMIYPSVHGALFTVDPITGNPDVFVLEVQEGQETGVHRLDPYERQPGEPRDWTQLKDMGLLLDERLLCYQTIEWAVSNGQVYLLRARPATRVPPYLPVAVRDAHDGRGPLELVHSSNCTTRALQPYSWYHRSRSTSTNAAYFRSANRLFASFSGRDEFFLRGYLYTRWRRLTLGTHGQVPLVRQFLVTAQRLLAARTLDRQFRALWQEKRPRLDQLNQLDVSTLSNHELSSYLQESMALNEAFIEQSGHLGDSYVVIPNILLSLHRRWLGDDKDCRSLLGMIKDQMSRRDQALYRLARADYSAAAERESAFRDFFHRYRHLFLCGDPLTEERDVCAVEGNEDRARQALREWENRGPQEAYEEKELVAAQREEIEHRILGHLGKIRGVAHRYLFDLARRYAPLRVDCNEPVLLCAVLERDAVAEVGRRLRATGLASVPQDACLLGCGEIIDWLEGTAEYDRIARLVSERKSLARRWWRYAPPDVLGGQVERSSVHVVFTVAGKNTLRGRAVSPGLVEGPARVVNTLGEATNVLAGEVLVCQDPLFEMSPLFSVVSAVLAEEGGLLSHAATLAREYGVPAIFGIGDATHLIHTGDHVQVDANRGIVALEQTELGQDEVT